MRKKAVSLFITIAGCIMLFASAGWSDTPAPPVNQTIGFDDGIFNNLTAADCRVCHEDPDIVDPTPNVDRHHLLYGSPLLQGECSVNGTICLSDADCNPGICISTGASCTENSNCPKFVLGETCGEVCIGETVIPNLDANQDGDDDTSYGCLSCHEQDTSGGVISFIVERDCLKCHVQDPGEASVHHLTAMAQGTDSPLGFPDVGDCTPCHGTLVDDIGDEHTILTYEPSMVTPKPSGGFGLPYNNRGKGAGACDYCHDWGSDTLSGVEVFTNADTHHNTGVFESETGVTNSDTCLWCHNMAMPEYDIRTCEGCHGYESLHNIQADSDGDNLIQPGIELPFFGHIGNPDDCWGCHGYAMSSASAPGFGPLTPYISSLDIPVITAGANTTVTLTGSAFINSYGTSLGENTVLLTAADGTSVMMTPDTISQVALTFTIPGTMATGNYTIQVVKDDSTISNPVVISIKPEVVINDVVCFKCLGTMTITGSGFREKPEGSDDYINVEEEDGRPLNIISWTDTEIQASGARCSGSLTVNAQLGSAIH